MLQKFKQQKYRRYLDMLPKVALECSDIAILKSPADYRQTLLEYIAKAQHRIYIIALYLEQDEAGYDVLSAIYQAKQANPKLDIAILVDFHRAQRGRIGDNTRSTNADWYCSMKQQYADIELPIYGVPINTREALGVLHLKGSIIDDTLIYTGASINNVYLHRLDKYRYDRYQVFKNKKLADSFVNYVQHNLIADLQAVHRLDECDRPHRTEIKKDVRKFRQSLRQAHYQLIPDAHEEQLAATPLVGLGKRNILNTTIKYLMNSTEKQLIICTPYFNLPLPFIKSIHRLLKKGKNVEIIVGDKTANDFYIPEDQPFRIIGALPYLYEINLRNFAIQFQEYIDKEQLTIRLWKDQDNSYHLKGIWVDRNWLLITGNNLNPRAINLDLENGVLIHDPHHELQEQTENELMQIRTHTQVITNYHQLQNDKFYPPKIHKLLRRLRRAGIDKIINRIL